MMVVIRKRKKKKPETKAPKKPYKPINPNTRRILEEIEPPKRKRSNRNRR